MVSGEGAILHRDLTEGDVANDERPTTVLL